MLAGGGGYGADHPHAGGENGVRSGDGRPPPRTIPTRVGRTPASRASCDRIRPDHPHAGGENATEQRPERAQHTDHPHAGGENMPVVDGRRDDLRGPSPRGWGERSLPPGPRPSPSDHPHAGGENAAARLQGRGLPPDHPHAGGENTWPTRMIRSILRTIPTRVGRTPTSARSRRAYRTIPTRVGRTAASPDTPAPIADHPHAGGENVEPPRDPVSRRTIPTRVGRTTFIDAIPYAEPDHPHAGGENAARDVSGPIALRTIPTRVGRTSQRHTISRSDSRTIPTRVGRTWRMPARIAWPADHPHAGGENSSGTAEPTNDDGPSPRGWGERHGLGAPC